MIRFPEDLTAEQFISDYWQKKPLVFRQAINQPEALIDPEQLLTLSQSEEVESRLIQQYPETGRYELADGPLSEQLLTSLKDTGHWTLLVQSVNLWQPQVAALMQHFPFIPSWRFDDIMISYATDQGGVGPHTDQYDVFLLQLSGKRRWRVGRKDMPVVHHITDSGLKQIAPFDAEIDVILEAGDMLYVPPATPHDGISQGTGMTLSVGYRAASLSEMTMMLAEQQASRENYYRDPEQWQSLMMGEISDQFMNQVCDWYQAQLSAVDISVAFGKLQTQPKQELLLQPADRPVLKFLQTGASLAVDPAARIAWWSGPEGLYLFANGEEILLAADAIDIVQAICCTQLIDLTYISAYIERKNLDKILEFLTDTGYLGCTDNDHERRH